MSEQQALPADMRNLSAAASTVAKQQISLRLVRILVGVLLIAFATFAIFASIDGLSTQMRGALSVFTATLIAWTVMDLPETPVALAGALALVLSGAVGERALFAALGSEIVVLMLAAFVIGAVLKQTGLAERCASRMLAPFQAVQGIFWATTGAIFLTAFLVPSTSARAAILMPIFLSLSAAIGRPTVTRGLALLFPSVILLSAAASLTGAGAHLVAAEAIRRVSGQSVDFATWALLSAPFALVSSLIACGLILFVFLNTEDRKALMTHGQGASKAFSNRDKTILAVVGATVALWASGSLHGVGLPIVALVGALVVASKSISGITFKAALKGVEWNLLLFLAATLVIGEALLETGAAKLVVDRVMATFQGSVAPAAWVLIAFAATVSALAHIVITSRTARATVLIPALALPLADLGVNPAAMILVVTLGSGFCQTLMVSAKPVTLFGGMEPPAFSAVDLLWLSALLFVPFVALLGAFAIFAWPLLGIRL
ncbi:di/tricarboxylate transporter [Aminobacter lissarensis]|uniref:Di/tricarboxylate transporter n=1 Tax=Aminobacter carboxidus TaxID=376165 RepID=A0A8E1WKY2_9HYPH|nr:SLC13 family permease [Aminobacter lissarensis]MBB6470433.1 di/tricarboxylate transporter [Aminobacter lissarensis]